MAKYTKLGLEAVITSIENKMESIEGKLSSIDVVLQKNTDSLSEHMKRSDNLESLVMTIQEKDLKPLQRHVHYVEGVFKFLGLIALLVGLISGIANLFGLV